MKVLVTGSTGFIGQHVCRVLLARGHAVRALARNPAAAAPLSAAGAEVVKGDVCEPATLPAAVEGCEAVLHLAGVVKALGRPAFFAVNAGGTRHLADAAIAAGATRFVLVSSLAAAGPSTAARPRTADDPPAPVSAYGESKLAAEAVLRDLAFRLEATVVRPPIVYGPGDREVLPPLLAMARAGLIVKAGLAEKRYSVVHVEDLAQGIALALEHGRRLGPAGGEGVYYLDDGATYTWEEIGRAALGPLGVSGRVLALPEAVSWVAAAGATAFAQLRRKAAVFSLDKVREIRQPSWTCDASRARSELGYAPRFLLGEGMRQTLVAEGHLAGGPAPSP
ncbi:NAD-dependent epimerase/dehydratase family protein [Anaeromyxobacter paludicola]|uniref:Epimerase n=1 Tax=Anaeromyxobacter paludicola TaxID=2918171 RepID=A0ABN6NAT5_9BACT|nr:NAD-dependent epimerase/dehydratase family protein [Anaeromyxobacter paludicola]BDG10362.1 epimerase [Anaeromyxobacter paludicola]